MDGRARLFLQISVGVRDIVADIDALSIKCGCDNVTVLTPKVETRLRSGTLAQIPLKLNCIFQGIIVEMTFRTGYPVVAPIEISIMTSSGIPPYAEDVNNFSTTKHDEIFPRACEILDYITQMHCHEGAGSRVEAIDEDISDFLPFAGGPVDTKQMTPFFTCIKCRFTLFDAKDLMDHSPDEKATQRRGGLQNSCTSYFLSESPSWLTTDSVDNGKLQCPKCTAKLGQWSWAGNTCSCGQWVAPAFQIIKAKVDLKPILKVSTDATSHEETPGPSSA